jgi:uncharacterized protein (DUF697 family)
MVLGRVGALAEFWRVVREINPQDVREEVEQPVHIVLMGEPGSGKRTLRRTLLQQAPAALELVPIRDQLPSPGAPSPADVGPAHVPVPGNPLALSIVELPPGLASLDDLPGGPPRGNFVLYLVDVARGVTHQQARLAHEAETRGQPVVIVLTKADLLPTASEPRWAAERILGGYASGGLVAVDARSPASGQERLAPVLLRALPNLSLALGRNLPLLRAPVAEQIIAETSRVNAEFALMSSLPANIPIIGAVMSSGADMLVLTKNQVMMLYKLAAVFGRSMEHKLSIAAEIVPVVGAAFFWRTMARTLVGLLPGIVSAVPKTMVAYVGTHTVGRAAHYYYASGRRPPEAVLNNFRREAVQLAKRIVPRPPDRVEAPPPALPADERARDQDRLASDE